MKESKSPQYRGGPKSGEKKSENETTKRSQKADTPKVKKQGIKTGTRKKKGVRPVLTPGRRMELSSKKIYKERNPAKKIGSKSLLLLEEKETHVWVISFFLDDYFRGDQWKKKDLQ